MRSKALGIQVCYCILTHTCVRVTTLESKCKKAKEVQSGVPVEKTEKSFLKMIWPANAINMKIYDRIAWRRARTLTSDKEKVTSNKSKKGDVTQSRDRAPTRRVKAKAENIARAAVVTLRWQQEIALNTYFGQLSV